MAAEASIAFPKAMRSEEYDRLREILQKYRPKRTLEIGLANGGSAAVICRFLAEHGGSHTAIDPYQSAPPPNGFGARGIEAVRSEGYGHLMTVIEQPNFLALPQLLQNKAKFDFILIDGWHSFDYAFLDYFSADLLLETGGVMVFHDTGWPTVHKVCMFLESHKQYDRIGPAPAVELSSLPQRLRRRLQQLVSGQGEEVRQRRTQWFSLAAYQKREDRMVHETTHHDF